jgi:vanillate O-demethylase ferredoxin subunit
VHESLRVGDRLRVSHPRNTFPLTESATASVFIAGGIGITPLWSMAQRLDALGRRWVLHYCARSRAHAAFLDAIEALAARSLSGELVVHFDDRSGGSPPDIGRIIAVAPPEAHLYCCGPQPMLSAYEKATRNWSAVQVHSEYFTARAGDTSTEGFKVSLARSGGEYEIPAGKSILEVLLDNGINAQFGCMQGVCGLCEVQVLAGEPDHRDNILDALTKASNTKMLICCSRSKSASVTLDL